MTRKTLLAVGRAPCAKKNDLSVFVYSQKTEDDRYVKVIISFVKFSDNIVQHFLSILLTQFTALFF